MKIGRLCGQRCLVGWRWKRRIKMSLVRIFTSCFIFSLLNNSRVNLTHQKNAWFWTWLLMKSTIWIWSMSLLRLEKRYLISQVSWKYWWRERWLLFRRNLPRIHKISLSRLKALISPWNFQISRNSLKGIFLSFIKSSLGLFEIDSVWTFHTYSVPYPILSSSIKHTSVTRMKDAIEFTSGVFLMSSKSLRKWIDSHLSLKFSES